MYPKRMKNPEHGFTHVYDTGEEARIRTHGWIAETEDFPREAAVEPHPIAIHEKEVEQETQAPIPPVKGRPGRKPKA